MQHTIENEFLTVTVESKGAELVSVGKCSEMDIILDLWISAVYNDERVQGSFTGPVAYFRDGSGNPLVSYSDLSARWGISKATVGRILKKLSRLCRISMFRSAEPEN